MVRVVRLERTVSWSQTRRDTNFAIPGYSLFCHDTTARGKNKVFSVCGHLCGQSRFCAVFGNRVKSRKRRCRKALRRFALPRPGYRHGTPKAGALPTALHPGMRFWHGCLRASAADTALTRGIQAKILYDTMRAKSSQTLDEPRRLPYNKPMSYCSYHL